MPAISAHDDSPNHDEHTDCQEQVNPSGTFERECTEGPDDDQCNTNQNTEIPFVGLAN